MTSSVTMPSRPRRCITTVRSAGTGAVRLRNLQRNPFDCYFCVEGKRIGVHRWPLTSLSTVLTTKFDTEWTAAVDIRIDGVSFAGFMAFREYCYSGRLNIMPSNVADILHLANEYQIQELTNCCSAYLYRSLSSANAIETLTLTTKYGIPVDTWGCAMILDNEVLDTEPFYGCDVATLHTLLEERAFFSYERDIFDAVMRWAERKCMAKGLDAGNCMNLRKELGKCFDLIQFKLMPNGAFVERYEKWPKLFAPGEVQEYLLYFARNHRTEQMEGE